MSVYLPKNSSLYWYDFWYKKVRHYGSTGKTDRREAENVERAEKDRVAAVFTLNGSHPKRMSVRHAAERLLRGSKREDYGKNLMKRDLDRLVNWIGPNTPIDEIDDELVSKLVQRRKSQYRYDDPTKGFISPRTVNQEVTRLLRSMLTRARLKWKIYLPNEPDWSEHMLREPGEIVRELKREQERRLERVESDDFRILRQFAIETGLRVREYAPLTWDQVDFTAGTIDVIQKGNRRRVIPMTDHIRSLLNSRRGHHPKFVFTYVATLTHHVGKHRELREKGKRYPISISWAQEKLTAYFRKAEIDDFRVHDLRHTAATRILRATQNLRAAQLLLGHADISSTERYAHLQTDDLLAAMNRRDAYYESPNAL